MGRATLDQNYRPTIIGVDHVGFTIPTEAAVNTTTHELLTSTVVTSSVLPTGAATSANQTNGNQISQVKETAPTDATKTNPALSLSYDANGNLIGLTQTIGVSTYSKTLTWTSGNLTNISKWT